MLSVDVGVGDGKAGDHAVPPIEPSQEMGIEVAEVVDGTAPGNGDTRAVPAAVRVSMMRWSGPK